MAEITPAMIIESIYGDIGNDKYTRRKVGQKSVSVICRKPRLSARQREKRRNRVVNKDFRVRQQRCQEILHDPIRRSLAQAQYDAAKKEHSKHPKGKMPGRLCDWLMSRISDP